MKKINVKKLGVCTFACSLLACAAGVAALQPESVFAETVTPIAVENLQTFAMKSGASVRINTADGENGLRYSVTMSEAEYEGLLANEEYTSVHFGVAIAPAAYHVENPLNEENMFTNPVYDWADENGEYTGSKTRIVNKASVVMSEDVYADGMMVMSASLLNIRDGAVTESNPNGVNNIAKKFIGVGYIRYQKADGTVDYLFAAENDNVRSIAQVAERAVADTSETALSETDKQKVAENYLNVDNLFGQFAQGSTYTWDYSHERKAYKDTCEIETSVTSTANTQNAANTTRTGSILHYTGTQAFVGIQLLPVYSKAYYQAMAAAYPTAKISFDIMVVPGAEATGDYYARTLGQNRDDVSVRRWMYKNEWQTLTVDLATYVANYDNMFASALQSTAATRDLVSVQRQKEANTEIEIYLTQPKLVMEDGFLNVDTDGIFATTATTMGGHYKYVLTNKETNATTTLTTAELPAIEGLSDSYDVALVNVGKNDVETTLFSTSYLVFSETAILNGSIVDFSSADFATKWNNSYATHWAYRGENDEMGIKLGETIGDKTGDFAYFYDHENTNNSGAYSHCFIGTDLPVALLEYFNEKGYSVAYDTWQDISAWGNGTYAAGVCTLPTLTDGVLGRTENITTMNEKWETITISLDVYLAALADFNANGLTVTNSIYHRPLKASGVNEGLSMSYYYFTELRLVKAE